MLHALLVDLILLLHLAFTLFVVRLNLLVYARLLARRRR